MLPTTRAVLDFIADFGEAAALLPAAAAVAVPLAVRRRWSAVLAWGGALAACALAALLLKTGIAGLDGGGSAPFHTAAVRPRPIVSGHACIAVAFYGGLAVLARRGAGGLGRAAALALAVVPATAICAAVWMLGWHNLPEIACGVLLGAVCPAVLAAALPVAPARSLGGSAAMLAAAALVVGALHGIRIDYAAAAAGGGGLLAAIGAL
jgi:hypothetical protein